jgi:glycosyltransferase involved in cell wall biosynthesis
MKIVILGNFPIYNYADQLGIKSDTVKRVTTWNENLATEMSNIPNTEIFFITSTKAIRKTEVIKRNNLTVYFIVFPPKVNIITLFRYAQYSITKVIDDINPDLVHGIGTEHIWPTIAINSKRKCLITIHGILHEFYKKEKLSYFSLKRYFIYLEKKILKNQQKIITINPYVVSVCDKLCEDHKYFNISNPISSVFRKLEADPENSHQILFIGDFELRKNIKLVLRALAELDDLIPRNYKLKIIGTIKDKKYYDTIFTGLPQSVLNRLTIIPFLLPEQIANEMSKSAILLLTSYNETAPMVIAEAMTIGLPVIATDVGGVKYMINNEINGYVIKSDSLLGLKKHLIELINNPILRKNVGNAARLFATKEYDSKIIAKKTIDVYKQILK